MQAQTIISFLFFTGLVGALTYWLTRKDDHKSTKGFFLAGRTLTFPLIAGSLLLTNLSTEQLVGLNGAAFNDGLCVMVWEVFAVLALVIMALFFLPRWLKSGVTTVPEFLEIRFDHQTQVISNLIFLIAYVGLLLPIILYTGATGMIGILDLNELMGIQSESLALWLIVWVVGIVGSIYALFGGLRSVAVSDTLNGIGLLVGGFLISAFALSSLGGDGGISSGVSKLTDVYGARLNSIGSKETSVPFGAIFSGIFLLHLFYWTTNQQIIQRTLGASSLAEGQKGVLLTGGLKLLGPLYLVIPGIIAYAMYQDGQLFQGAEFQGGEVKLSDHAYGELVSRVLPAPLAGFFAAAMIGAILSSFNSALNSSCTLFSLGLYRNVINPTATDQQLVKASKTFGWIVAIAAMCIAPLLANTPKGIFDYLQKMNGMYFIPIFAVVVIGMLNRRVPPVAAKVGLIGGVAIIAIGYFVPPFNLVVDSMHEFYFLGTVFMWLLIIMMVIGAISPRSEEWTQQDAKAVDLTPWKYARPTAIVLAIIVLLIYATFADFSVLKPN
jgi:SSS family solute:Na+ symporter